jgi:hypothetical protein
VNRRLGGIAAVVTLLEGFSRVYLGEHHPHDIAAAFVLGATIMVNGCQPNRSFGGIGSGGSTSRYW